MLQKHLVQTTGCHGCCLWSVSLLSNPAIVYSRMRASWLVWSTGSPLLAWCWKVPSAGNCCLCFQLSCLIRHSHIWVGVRYSGDLMDLLNTSHIEDFAVGESPRCLRHGIKDDVTDWKKNKINCFPFVLPTCWGVCPCSIYNSWGFTHAFESWMSPGFRTHWYGTRLMSSLWWEVATCPICIDWTRLQVLLCLLCQRHTPDINHSPGGTVCAASSGMSSWLGFTSTIMYEDAHMHTH